MSEPFLELRTQVARANRALADDGLVIQAFGNVSQVDRTEEVFAIKPSGLPCASVQPDDIVVVSLSDGTVMWGDHRPSADTPTHRVLYDRLATLGGVAHTHSRFATPWAQAQRAIPCLGTTHADVFRGPVPVTRPLTPEEIADDYEANTGLVVVERFLGHDLDPDEHPGALVACHGPFTWGPDAASAVSAAASLEFIAELASRTLAIEAQAQPVFDGLVERHFSRKHGPLAYYGQP